MGSKHKWTSECGCKHEDWPVVEYCKEHNPGLIAQERDRYLRALSQIRELQPEEPTDTTISVYSQGRHDGQMASSPDSRRGLAP